MDIKINLIPPQKREKILEAKRFGLIVKTETGIFIVLLAFLAVLSSFNYILELNASLISSNADSFGNKTQYEKMARFDEEFKLANEETAKIMNIQKDQLYWSELFSIFNGLDFFGISMESVSTKDYRIFLAGKADNRDALISFKERVEKEECFSEVGLPLSNLVAKENVDFQMELTMAESCLKKQ